MASHEGHMYHHSAVGGEPVAGFYRTFCQAQGCRWQTDTLTRWGARLAVRRHRKYIARKERVDRI